MARLTEEMVIARTRQSNLGAIKKLNCWGSDLADVTLLRRINNIEVLSLSVNKISSLADFQFCWNLRELFVRKNNIKDLNQVCYLKRLTKLRNLWLDENPCADCEGYRLAVIRCLPHLEKLDNEQVQPEERDDALKRGAQLIHPEDEQPTNYENDRGDEDYQVEAEELEEDALAQNQYNLQIDDTKSSADEEYETGRLTSMSREYSPERNTNSGSNMQQTYVNRPQYEVEDNVVHQHDNTSSVEINSLHNNQPSCEKDNLSRQHRYQQIHPQVEHFHNQVQQNQIPCTENRVAANERPSVQPHMCNIEQSRICPMNHRPHCFRRPTTRNSNILSAVLCLVKELDYPSLEVVEMAVRCRMNELGE